MKKVIFVVDDQPLVADTLAQVLNSTNDGFIAVSHHSAQSAIAVSQGLRPDLIVLDVRMPGVRGLEHAQQLRDILGIPVLLISGSLSTSGIIEAAAADGLAPFPIMPKPVHPRDLIEQIHSQLGAAKTAAQLD